MALKQSKQSFTVNSLNLHEINDSFQRIQQELDKFTGAETYTVTNGTTDRTFNANSTTVNELADVLNTLITDLRTAGVLL